MTTTFICHVKGSFTVFLVYPVTETNCPLLMFSVCYDIISTELGKGNDFYFGTPHSEATHSCIHNVFLPQLVPFWNIFLQIIEMYWVLYVIAQYMSYDGTICVSACQKQWKCIKETCSICSCLYKGGIGGLANFSPIPK